MLEHLEGKGEEGGQICIKEKGQIYIKHTYTPQSNNFRLKNKGGVVVNPQPINKIIKALSFKDLIK